MTVMSCADHPSALRPGERRVTSKLSRGEQGITEELDTYKLSLHLLSILSASIIYLYFILKENIDPFLCNPIQWCDSEIFVPSYLMHPVYFDVHRKVKSDGPFVHKTTEM